MNSNITELERLREDNSILTKCLSALYDAYVDQVGDECDCMPEPENFGHVCPQCMAKTLLMREDEYN